MMSSWSARRSYSLQVASSEPVITAFPLGKNWKKERRSETWPQKSGQVTSSQKSVMEVILTPMALMSLSWPPKVCLHAPSLMSHSLAVKSQAPEMKNLKSGDTARDMQSPWCPAKMVFWVPVSMSHSTLEEDEQRQCSKGSGKIHV